MKTARRGKHQDDSESPSKRAKQGKNIVLDMRFDVSSLPKDIRLEIYNQMIKKSSINC